MPTRNLAKSTDLLEPNHVSHLERLPRGECDSQSLECVFGRDQKRLVGFER
jgi:hypothetical protein